MQTLQIVLACISVAAAVFALFAACMALREIRKAREPEETPLPPEKIHDEAVEDALLWCVRHLSEYAYDKTLRDPKNGVIRAVEAIKARRVEKPR